jgi:Cd2+/Zn2+-exporting ATPase
MRASTVCTNCEQHAESTFRIEGLCCHKEAATLEQRLAKLQGVERLALDVVSQRLRVAYDAAVTTSSAISEAVAETGMRAWVDQDRTAAPPSSAAATRQAVLLGVAAAALGTGLLLHATGSPEPWTIALMVLAVVTGGATTVRRAVLSIRQRTLDMYVLMLVAVIGAALIGEWYEAATVIVLFAFAGVLERRSLDRARRAIGALLNVEETDVRVRRPDGDRRVPLAQIRAGELILLSPGERIPLDGTVVSGFSDVNQAPVTGESVPVTKEPGERVFAGTINGHGALDVRVTAVGEDTTLARIIHLVERAQEQRAPSQAWVDRFAQRYTPIVLLLAALVAILPPLLLAQPFALWIYRALVLLVIACPCALVISTPVSIVSALAAAARRGVLIKGGVFLEKLAEVKAVALDKTGTLTRGSLSVHEVFAVEGQDEATVVATAAALGAHSEHPLARAVNGYAIAHGVPPDAAVAVRALPGQGAEGRIAQDDVLIGSARLFEERGLFAPNGATGAVAGHATRSAALERAPSPPAPSPKGEGEICEPHDQDRAPAADGFASRLSDMAARGMTLVLVARAGRVLGVVGLRDEVRAHGREAVDLLRAAGIEHVALLTGDHEHSAQAAADAGRVDSVESALLPADKVKAIERIRARHGAVAMVGDGINDAPALAAADVGVAMGVAGSDAAIETADVALMADDLRALPYVLRLGRATLSTIRINVAIALGLKLAFMTLAIFGVATLWMAVIADMGASFLVVGNGLRLLRLR